MKMKILGNVSKDIFQIVLRSDENGIFIYDVDFHPQTPVFPSKITVEFNLDCINAFSLWNAQCGFVRNILSDWRPNRQASLSRLACGIPIQSIISQDGNNAFTISVTDAKTPIEISTGIEEFHKTCLCKISFFTLPVGRVTEYKTQIIIDKRSIPFYKAIKAAAERMRTGEQYVPIDAQQPMYSTWYSFHQELNEKELLRECERAYKLGMRSVIIDDGWQTDNNSGGYAYCGDWQVCESKINNMQAFVERIHSIGMKVLLWYSVPYIGKKSKIWDRFKGKYLDSEENEWNCLDPRFPEVREYLVGIYKKAAIEWKLDGFKLDFIDSFSITEYSDKNGIGRDFESLEDAIECLLSDIYTGLRNINPDILLEFRQGYIGPVITQYGNMIRVGDCALDALANRVGVLDLRMTSGKAAVHSDMITWNDNDTNESMAKQLIAALFGVPQISVRLDKITEEHYDVLKFWLDFWIEHREILLDGNLKIYNSEMNYSMARAEIKNNSVCVCYGVNIVEYHGGKLTVVNGTGEGFIPIKANERIQYSIFDCKGMLIDDGIRSINDVTLFQVPQSGVLKIKIEDRAY